MVVIVVAFVMYGALAANWSNLITAPYRIEAMIGITVLLIGWAVLRTLRKWQWHRTALDQVVVLWLIAFAVSLLANSDVWRRIVIGLWFCGLYILFWYLVHDCIANGFLKRATLVDGMLLAGVPVIIANYGQLWDWFQKGHVGDPPVLLSMLDNPNPLGTVMIVLLCLALGRFFMLRGVLRIIPGIYVLLTLVILFQTHSRGSWLGSGVGLIVFGLLYVLYRRVRLNLWVIGGLGTVAGIVLIGVTLYRGWDDNGRRYIYSTALQMFKEKPLTGYGLYTFGRGLMRMVGVIPTTTTHAHAHDLILNIAAELGIIGLIAFFATVIVLTLKVRDNWRAANSSLESGSEGGSEGGSERGSENRQQILIAGAIAATAGVALHHVVDVTAMLPAVALTAFIPMIVAVAPIIPQPIQIPRVRYALLTSLAVIILLAGAWDTYTYNLYYTAITYAMHTSDPVGTVALLQPAIDDDPRMPVYRVMQAYFLSYTGDTQAEDAAFATLCKLEPDYAAAPYDGQVAILQFLHLSLVTPRSIWDAHPCAQAASSEFGR